MSAHERPRSAGRAVALSYDGGSGAPVVVASGMGYMAEKIVEVAAESGVPVYEDNSLATMLSQLSLGQEISTMARYRESGISCPSDSWDSMVARELSS